MQTTKNKEVCLRFDDAEIGSEIKSLTIFSSLNCSQLQYSASCCLYSLSLIPSVIKLSQWDLHCWSATADNFPDCTGIITDKLIM